MKVPYVDIHTHKRPHIDSSNISLYNHEWHDQKPNHNYLCASIHPWNVPQTIEMGIEFLNKSFKSEHYIALGEVGLDKKSSTNWNTQKEHFVAALQFSKEKSISVVILHSVKSHTECIAEVQKLELQSSIIFHDYHGSIEQTKEILMHSNTYISLGSVLERPNSKLYKHLKELPLERLFLETDDGKQSIEDVYHNYCQLTGHDIITLKKSCYNNFKKIFPGTLNE
jgi:TatD DNase family protein